MNTETIDLVNRVARSTVAVVDTVSSRGGFRGEELSTIGQLRSVHLSDSKSRSSTKRKRRRNRGVK